MKRLIALLVLCGVIAVTSIGCGDTKATSGSKAGGGAATGGDSKGK